MHFFQCSHDKGHIIQYTQDLSLSGDVANKGAQNITYKQNHSDPNPFLAIRPLHLLITPIRMDTITSHYE